MLCYFFRFDLKKKIFAILNTTTIPVLLDGFPRVGDGESFEIVFALKDRFFRFTLQPSLIQTTCYGDRLGGLHKNGFGDLRLVLSLELVHGVLA